MKPRLIILVAVLGVAAVLAGWVYELRLRSPLQPQELLVPDNIDYFLTELDFRSIDDSGKLEFAFRSPRLEHFRRDDVSIIETPSLRIYTEPENWQVVAQEGEFVHRDNLLRLSRRVVMDRSGADPIRISTESIRFEPDLDRITAESPLVIESSRGRIEAEQASFDLAGGVYRFNRSRAVYSQ